jgi:hypothetical protein
MLDQNPSSEEIVFSTYQASHTMPSLAGRAALPKKEFSSGKRTNYQLYAYRG